MNRRGAVLTSCTITALLAGACAAAAPGPAQISAEAIPAAVSLALLGAALVVISLARHAIRARRSSRASF